MIMTCLLSDNLIFLLDFFIHPSEFPYLSDLSLRHYPNHVHTYLLLWRSPCFGAKKKKTRRPPTGPKSPRLPTPPSSNKHRPHTTTPCPSMRTIRAIDQSTTINPTLARATLHFPTLSVAWTHICCQTGPKRCTRNPIARATCHLCSLTSPPLVKVAWEKILKKILKNIPH